MKEKRRVSGILLMVAVLGLAAELPLVGLVMAQSDGAGENKLVLDGSTTVGPIAKAFAEHYMSLHPDVNVTVSESGSGNGAKSLVNGACDIANMSRFMKDKEFKAAVDKGIFPVAHVVAMDGIAVCVHPSNPVSVKGLSSDEVKNVYLGKITNWKELGGPDREIVVISRDTNSGTFDTFKNLVMHKEAEADGVERVNSNGMMRRRIKSTSAAIGYLGLGYVDEEVKAIEVDGVYPDKGTVASGQYPVARPLFMFTNGYPKLGSHLHAFVTMHYTKKGQEIIESIGFVPLTKY